MWFHFIHNGRGNAYFKILFILWSCIVHNKTYRQNVINISGSVVLQQNRKREREKKRERERERRKIVEVLTSLTSTNINRKFEGFKWRYDISNELHVRVGCVIVQQNHMWRVGMSVHEHCHCCRLCGAYCTSELCVQSFARTDMCMYIMCVCIYMYVLAYVYIKIHVYVCVHVCVCVCT